MITLQPRVNGRLADNSQVTAEQQGVCWLGSLAVDRPDAIANHILESVFPGAIILMHDGSGDRSQSVAALQQVLSQLQQQGYVFNVLCR